MQNSDGRQQREHRRPDPADSPPRGRPGHRTASVRPAAGPDFVDHSRRRAVRDSEVRRPRCRPATCRSRTSATSSSSKSRRRSFATWPATLFKELQESATIQNVWNNPQLRAQMPGVVATINGEPIPYKELADECLLRYGEAGARRRDFAPAAAASAGQGERHGHASRISTPKSPTRRSWPASSTPRASPTSTSGFKTATEEQGVTEGQYMRDSVWPSAALKKLTGSTIKVTEDDIQKGFEANYGERVRCRAIVLGNMRRAQEVWAKARQNPSLDYFGDLAEEYSIEPHQQGAPRRSAADPPLRRPAAARGSGLRAAAGRAFGHHPTGRQVRDSQVRRPHRSRSTSTRRRSATSSTRTSSRRSCAWR